MEAPNKLQKPKIFDIHNDNQIQNAVQDETVPASAQPVETGVFSN